MLKALAACVAVLWVGVAVTVGVGVWVAVGVACGITSGAGEAALAAAALSGAAILLERTTSRTRVAEWIEGQEDRDGMLRG